MKRALATVAGLFALLVAGCGDTGVAPPPPTTEQTTEVRPPVSLLPTPEVTVPTEAPRAEATEPPTTKTTPRTRVPRALVGTWDGDRATISFSRAGDVTVVQKRGGTSPGPW